MADMLTEQDITTANLDEMFKRAFFKTSLDNDGDLVVHTDGPRVIVTINESNKLLKFMSIYGIKESAPLEAAHAFVNKMNDEIIFARFSVPESRKDVLIADYYIPFEEGLPAFQLVSAMRLFARVVPSAIRACDDDDIVE